MGLKMAEYQQFPVADYDYFARPDPVSVPKTDPDFLPYWARCRVQCAQNLLDSSDEPIEYDENDEDYSDNCFFFPEDCSWTPPKDWSVEAHCRPSRDLPTIQLQLPTPAAQYESDIMIPGLPDIKMLDSEALGDLLEDNLSPPEITTILVFATNGAVFAYSSTLTSRQLRNLSATYGAAYTCYAKTASSGNLTGVNPASHPSSYVTAQSMSLGDVGSIVFELDDSVAVVTRIADRVLLAAVGPSKSTANGDEHDDTNGNGNGNGAISDGSGDGLRTPTNPNPGSANGLDAQHEIDRSADLERLKSLNLSAEPAVLLALESKCAALGRFLGQKLSDLESPEDF
ncbi:uncharacterized protein N7443_008904 [Penicillium atrosanguineum]|uniref:Uncharacterized protein n=1 Tax=Penicillium atrosanguineum TaxID=1132637 RepID=A0A9W9PNY9_9EURO|nr:uncharacterized protein N7443_008904 [Penicillium atrosanguineum]KAJ5292951.1 hypothetical protein N7443_008904 [Penicillium atrosanguineum]KAJ5303011.1 hypothetical protein N7476_009810 [Penicillium atrosanguineum]